jgi:hypothetical protein
VAAALPGVFMAPAALAQFAGHYRLGTSYDERQVNLCETKSEALRIASVFRDHGPRPGYTALSDSTLCRIDVAGFTTEEIVAEIVVDPSTAGEYFVRFVRVTLEDERIQFLVTTRPVVE